MLLALLKVHRICKQLLVKHHKKNLVNVKYFWLMKKHRFQLLYGVNRWIEKLEKNDFFLKRFLFRQKNLMDQQIQLLLLKELKLEIIMVIFEKTKRDLNEQRNYFLGRTLSCVNSTLIRLDPTETERTVELRVWYDNEGKSLDLPDLSKGADIGSRQSCIYLLIRIHSYSYYFSTYKNVFSNNIRRARSR